ncbi:helix-turn-helix domain-containing protein [Marmoricola sp. URHA0025 HA25]
MTPDLLELSRAIDPVELGQRIRTARIAAGLTQADIAGGDVSPAHISRIESGDRRLDNKLLQRIASRLDVTVEELLTGVSIDQQRQIELLLDFSEMALALGENTTALEHTTEAVRGLDVPGLRNLQRRALHLHGLALEAHGDLRQAIQTLEQVTSTPRTDTLWLRAVVALTRCYCEIGDAGRAIELGEHAAVIARELNLEGLSEANQLAIAIAGAYMQRGDNQLRTRAVQVRHPSLRRTRNPTRPGARVLASERCRSRARCVRCRPRPV